MKLKIDINELTEGEKAKLLRALKIWSSDDLRPANDSSLPFIVLDHALACAEKDLSERLVLSEKLSARERAEHASLIMKLEGMKKEEADAAAEDSAAAEKRAAENAAEKELAEAAARAEKRAAEKRGEELETAACELDEIAAKISGLLGEARSLVEGLHSAAPGVANRASAYWLHSMFVDLGESESGRPMCSLRDTVRELEAKAAEIRSPSA